MKNKKIKFDLTVVQKSILDIVKSKGSITLEYSNSTPFNGVVGSISGIRGYTRFDIEEMVKFKVLKVTKDKNKRIFEINNLEVK